MVEEGQQAPPFTLPMAGGTGIHDISRFDLTEAVANGPLVLAFYPAAFSGGCTAEMCAFRDSLNEFDALSVDIYGISVDLPYAQNAWIQAENLNIPMISDWNHEIIKRYDVVRSDVGGSIETARRSVFLVDADGIVQYRWIQEGDLPDFTDVVAEIQAVAKSVDT